MYGYNNVVTVFDIKKHRMFQFIICGLTIRSNNQIFPRVCIHMDFIV